MKHDLVELVMHLLCDWVVVGWMGSQGRLEKQPIMAFEG